MSFVELNNNTLGSLPSTIVPLKYNRNDSKDKNKGGIIHFGVGAFHRSHQALYLDEVLAKTGNRDWFLVGVGLLPFDLPMRDAMKAQDCLYTLHEKAPNGTTEIRVVQSILEYIYAPDSWEAVIKRMIDPAIKIVSLTITEGGYLMNNSGEFTLDHPSVVKDLTSPQLPQTAFGLIIEALNLRRKAGTPAFTVMSCDNLRHNGNTAKKACLTFARARDPELAKWIEENVSFPNAMVDRITPAMNATLRDSLNAESKIHDLIPVISEDFTQWVIEDNFKYGRPSYELAGATITQNVEPYEEAKIRLLNGSHQMLSYPAFLSGQRRVDVALADPLFMQFIRDFLNKDSGPWLKSIPGMDLDVYKETLLQRFCNAAIGDQLARLCLDGGSKIPTFLLPTIKANVQAHGTCHRLAYLLACYNHYIHTKTDDLGQTFQLQEPNAMALLEPIIASPDPMTFIKNHELVGDSANYPQFVKDYLTCHEHVQKEGARKTLENLEAILKK
eukprot:Phypoly_transcript_05859.p1 GENE.Phypoly_transcript_05859~~Phypoly_transcript_05859.p1  ORF type:complete len:500 (+),score=83.87 Phypoly_transcript_05859:253-1752(+)